MSGPPVIRTTAPRGPGRGALCRGRSGVARRERRRSRLARSLACVRPPQAGRAARVERPFPPVAPTAPVDDAATLRASLMRPRSRRARSITTARMPSGNSNSAMNTDMACRRFPRAGEYKPDGPPDHCTWSPPHQRPHPHRDRGASLTKRPPLRAEPPQPSAKGGAASCRPGALGLPTTPVPSQVRRRRPEFNESMSASLRPNGGWACLGSRAGELVLRRDDADGAITSARGRRW
jgi:hypothetical protein